MEVDGYVSNDTRYCYVLLFFCKVSERGKTGIMGNFVRAFQGKHGSRHFLCGKFLVGMTNKTVVSKSMSLPNNHLLV
jgi:hypothetical protein